MGSGALMLISIVFIWVLSLAHHKLRRLYIERESQVGFYWWEEEEELVVYCIQIWMWRNWRLLAEVR
ncbi:hypothetical protein LWI29_007541 [Acer saccharum]|uniref:Uncharacterized protein n=1 Tax=Acer saccharum TaxID=4024 RepID=A0AA39W5Z0_ACESA|nr:hypothetical protein LWI29_007541 [Acer saccharum]